MTKNKKNLLILGTIVLLIAVSIIFFFVFKEKPTYTVTFDTRGGTTIANSIIEKNSKITKPTDPKKEDYIFVEWLLDGKKFDFESKVTKNIELVAKWVQKVYTVKVSIIDQYSPDRVLTVYEDGNQINVSSVKYGNTILCSGNNLVVNMYEIDGISSVTVILNGGTSVTASIS